MKKFMLENCPCEHSWHDAKCDELFDSEYDLNEVKSLEPDAVFYWYVSGDYEGNGELIATKDGRWYFKSLSHCSCYGPLDGFASDISEYEYESLDDLLEKGTDDWQDGYKGLVSLAKENGYK